MQLVHKQVLLGMFNDHFDSVHDTIEFADYQFSPALTLRKLDIEAYKQEFFSWLENEVGAERLIHESGRYYLPNLEEMENEQA